MKHSRKWISALATVHVLVGVTAWMAFGHWRGEIAEMLAISVPFAQGSLLGIWAALGGKPAPWRLLAATVVLVISSRFLEWLPPVGLGAIYTFYLLGQSLGTAVPLLALRLAGLRLIVPTARAESEEGRSLQFSLRGLLEWTTALAVLLGTVPLMPEKFRYLFVSLSALVRILLLFGSASLLALACLWGALGKQRTAIRLVILGVVGLLAAVVVEKAFSSLDLDETLWLFSLYTLWTAGSLWVFRAAGYRIAWRRRTAPTESLDNTLGRDS